MKKSKMQKVIESDLNSDAAVKFDSNLRRGYLFMITDLAQRTNTTEQPDGIEAIVRENPSETIGLQEWYRIEI